MKLEKCNPFIMVGGWIGAIIGVMFFSSSPLIAYIIDLSESNNFFLQYLYFGDGISELPPIFVYAWIYIPTLFLIGWLVQLLLRKVKGGSFFSSKP